MAENSLIPAASDEREALDALRERAFDWHERGELGSAQRAYRDLLSRSADDLEVIRALGVLSLQIGQYADALELLTRAMARDESAAAHFDLGNALLGLSRAEEALRHYDRAIALQPDHAGAHLNRGQALLALGYSLEALASFDEALGSRPDFFEAHISRADLLVGLNRPADAISSYDRAGALQPSLAAIHLKRCAPLAALNRWQDVLTSIDRAILLGEESAAAHTFRGLSQAGLERLPEALQSYDRALAIDAAYTHAYINRGALLRRLGRLDQAIESYAAALAREPENFAAISNCAAALLDMRRFQEALDAFDRALALQADRAELHLGRASALLGLERFEAALLGYGEAFARDCNAAAAYQGRGTALLALGRADEAMSDYDKALSLRPDFAEAHLGRGRALQTLHLPTEALASFDRALEIKADYAEAFLSRATLFVDLKSWDAALADLDRAISLKPDYAGAYFNRGAVLFELQQYAAARESYDKAIAITADGGFLHGQRRHARMQACDWSELEREDEELAARIERGEPAAAPGPVLTMADSPELQAKAARIWVQKRYPAAVLQPLPSRYPEHDRIRVGYFSADYRDHATMHLAAGLLETHDRSKVRVTAFSFGSDPQDAMTSRVKAACEEFIDVSHHSDRAVAALAREMEIDIAVDLHGFTSGGRPGVFAMRAAPLQVNYLGYPGTMAAEYMDYVVADRTVIPEASRRHFQEKIIYLPDSYQVNDARRPISDRIFERAACGLPAEGFIFCCFNSSYKITPTTFDGWMRILKRVEGSVLWLLDSNRTAVDNLRREAVRRGVAAERLVFAARVPMAEHLARHRLADLCLDTLPYNAHTTASDALWAGLPVLTRAGEAFAARVAASLLSAANLPELVASSQAQYEDVAAELAVNRVRLAMIKQKLNDNRLSAALFDTRLYARHLETAYRKIYERNQAGYSPDHIYLDRD